MSFYSRVQNFASTIANSICKSKAEDILYQNGTSDPITIKAIPEKSDKSLVDLLGGNSEDSVRNFYIPASQKDGSGSIIFPRTNEPDVTDRITYPTNAAYFYTVTKVSKDSVGAGYLIQTKRHHQQSIGAT